MNEKEQEDEIGAEAVIFVIKALPDDGVPASARLRRLLKAMLRGDMDRKELAHLLHARRAMEREGKP